MNFIYSYIIIPVIQFFVFFIRRFNEKLNEREILSKKNLEDFDLLKTGTRIWFHAASMGEFEQAKPVIEYIKKNHSNYQIICSFFSPSGYRNQKNYVFADYIFYLPIDSKKNSKKFIDKIKPDVAVFIRYEIWYNFIIELNYNSIPIFLICATKPGNYFLSNIFKKFYRTCYSLFCEIYTVGVEHTVYFENLKLTSKIKTLSDTRFDRISEIVELASLNPVIPKEIFNSEDRILVAGSTWQPDEEILIDSIFKFNLESKIKIRLILVPHEPDEKNLLRLKQRLPDSILLSELINRIKQDEISIIRENLKNKIIIVDSIGKLLRLYSVADMAYIGGAFGVGVHSVTEAAGYGLPLATGFKMTNSPDAVNLNKIGVLNIIKNSDELIEWLNQITSDESYYFEIKEKAHRYVFDSVGSSKIIAESIINSIY